MLENVALNHTDTKQTQQKALIVWQLSRQIANRSISEQANAIDENTARGLSLRFATLTWLVFV
jgi:hypothetical protein